MCLKPVPHKAALWTSGWQAKHVITEGGWQPDGCASLPSSGLESASFCLAHTVEARPVQGLWGLRNNNSDTPEEASLPLCSGIFMQNLFLCLCHRLLDCHIFSVRRSLNHRHRAGLGEPEDRDRPSSGPSGGPGCWSPSSLLSLSLPLEWFRLPVPVWAILAGGEAPKVRTSTYRKCSFPI